MKKIFILLVFILLQNCSKQKVMLICGDHICINNEEAEQFFEENLSIEIKIENKKQSRKFDLIELNMRENQNNIKSVSINEKRKLKNKIKILNNKEIKKIKSKIKQNKDKKKLAKKVDMNKEELKSSDNSKNFDIKKKDDQTLNVQDVCKIIEKCNIEQISNFLIKEGKKKKFPDITLRE